MRSESEHCLGISSQNFWTNGIITAVQVSVKKKTTNETAQLEKGTSDTYMQLITKVDACLKCTDHSLSSHRFVFYLLKRRILGGSRQCNFIGEPQLINNYCCCRLILKTLIFYQLLLSICNITLVQNARKPGTQRLRVKSLYYRELYI